MSVVFDIDKFDICIAGAGVMGLAIAFELATRYKGKGNSILVLEQESSFGQHTSSRNSEVIHAGIYYPPNSLKARFCIPGKERLYAHCEQYDIPFKRTGKLIVAKEAEFKALENIEQNAIDIGLRDLQHIDKARLKEFEPEVEADAALLSPSTGIIDSHSYMQSLLHLSENLGVQFAPFTRVKNVDKKGEEFSVECELVDKVNTEIYQFHCQQFVNAAGLGAQSLASKIDSVPVHTIPRLFYCKGDYFDYRGRNPFRHLIYPMPEANTAGLGIHATMDMSSQLKFGPDTQYIERINYDIDEQKSTSFAERISSYFPAIKSSDLRPSYSGIRPKLAGPGEAAADYVIQDENDHGVPGLIQLFGMESPALTSSLSIADYVAAKVTI